MSQTKTIAPSRPSIFDNLTEKYYPELADVRSVKRRRPRAPGPWGVLALVGLLGASVLSLYVRAGDSPPTPSKMQSVSAFGPSEAEEVPERHPAVIPFVEPALETELEDQRASSPTPTGLRPALLAPGQPLKISAEDLVLSVSKEALPPRKEKEAKEKEAAQCSGADLRNPVKRYWSAPEYPETARQAFEEGTVVVEAQIDKAGTVEKVWPLRGATPELDRAALEAVATWSFEPATCAGQPIAGRYRTALHFDLRSPENSEGNTEKAASGDLVPPVKLFAPQPTYPPAEWVAAVEGDVTLRATVDQAGLVAAVEVLQGVSPGLDEAAVRALKSWRFHPARRGVEPVRFEQVLTFRFRR
jgi:TonB family protein